LRGTGKRPFAIFADEFLFFNLQALPAIIPTLATGAIFIATSSVAPDGDSPIMRLLDVKYPNGKPVVEKLCYIQSCDDCKRRGTEDRCTHIRRPPQHFQSHATQDRVNCLMSFDAEAKARELDNVGDKPLITSAFKKEWIDQMVSDPYRIKQNVPHIFITIDPSAGKDRNYYALLSAIFIKGECIILGGECINCCGIFSLSLSLISPLFSYTHFVHRYIYISVSPHTHHNMTISHFNMR
jgi:hypothetical protein